VFRHYKKIIHLLQSLFLAIAVNGQIDESVAVAPLVVVPTNDFEKVLVQKYAGRCVHNGTTCIMDEIGRYHLVFGVS
jgi:hypothetical protein